MPSPFPGMDPFLEDPEEFPDLHTLLVTHLREGLSAVLPKPYYARTGKRAWVDISERYIGPDVNVLRPKPNGGQVGGPELGGGLAVATAVRSEPVIVRVPHDEMWESFVDIYTPRGGKRLVASIEVLSPTNKTPRQKGWKLYRRKQREILKSEVHLIEIDFLRGGTHTTAVPLDRALEKTGLFDYHVCIHRFDESEEFLVYPIRLEQQLPELAVPLLPGDTPVLLDLQKVFDRCYDAGQYQGQLDYDPDKLIPPPRPEQLAWAKELLRTKGLLPPAAASV